MFLFFDLGVWFWAVALMDLTILGMDGAVHRTVITMRGLHLSCPFDDIYWMCCPIPTRYIESIEGNEANTPTEDTAMLLFISAPELLYEIAHLKSQVEAHKESIASPTSPIQKKRPELSMVWHKEFDGKRERMVARWVVDAVGREC